jgi:hypothetical protein
MVQITGEIDIRRPVEIVFDTLADPRQERKYNDRVLAAEMLTSGPITVGSRFEQQVRALGRTDLPTIDITGYERPSRLALTINTAAMVTSGDLHFEEVSEGTRDRYAWDMRARGVVRLFEPLLGLFGARLVRGVWDGLRRFLDGEAAYGAASSEKPRKACRTDSCSSTPARGTLARRRVAGSFLMYCDSCRHA